ncbi:hypothetical protein RND81_01G115200 [Saponaria officinalis]|uniref:CCT domain-containing protein n=1 Tax=Saponaria officinalis TaxID=3572 RepID=A0AAW1NI27_SAPOF
MYNRNCDVYDQTSRFYGQFDVSNLPPLFAQSLTCEFDSVHETAMLENTNGSTSTGSGCTGSSYLGSPSSPISCTSSHPPHSTRTSFQRSLSSHSLQTNGLHQPFSNPLTGQDVGYLKRVSSTSDMDQRVNTLRHHYHHEGSPLANETASIIEGMTKPCRYTPEEKKERIERYRSKRSQRNFNKKIQYTCRKTLADSRPRVRGRFTRNDELEKSDYSQNVQWAQLAGDEDEEDWISLLESISSTIVP